MEMKYKRWYEDKYLYLSLGLCFFLAVVSLLYFIIKGGGIFTLMTDFNAQQIPFTIAASDAIKNGELGWLWNVDLGTSLIGAFSFYNLGSPFFWVSLLFPSEYFPYIVGWLLILKYAVAGASAYLFICRFVNKRECAMMGAVLYAFSGFQSVNLLFHFHDVVAFFPLLLLGLEKLVVDKKRGYFVLGVFLNCLLNYFFFPGEVIFLVLYFICRFGIKKDTVSFIVQCCIEGIIGIGMACFLFLPSLLAVSSNPKALNNIFKSGNFIYSGKRYLELIRGILLPAEPMYAQSVIETEDFTSTSAYLPGVGLILPLSYILKKNDWIRKLLIVSLLISLFPVLNSIFYGFSQDYRRWWYMPILIMALASAKVMDDSDKFAIKTVTGIVSGIILIFILGIIVLSRTGYIEIDSTRRFAGSVLFVLLCNVLLFVVAKRSVLFSKAIWILVLLTSILTTTWMIYEYKVTAPASQELKAKWEADRELEHIDINYRYDADNSAQSIGGIHGLRIYSSTITGAIFEMHQAMGLSRTPAVVLFDVPGVMQWLGGKYQILQEAKPFLVEQPACPIGFTYDDYILKSEFEQLDIQLRGIAAIMGLVIPDEKEESVSEYLKKIDIHTIDENKLNNTEDYIVKNVANIVNIYEMSSKGFQAQAYRDKGSYAFFSVPGDAGWTAYVNGKKADIINVNGLMSVRLEVGENNIQFEYKIPGQYLGIILSILSTIALGTYVWYFKRLKSNEK